MTLTFDHSRSHYTFLASHRQTGQENQREPFHQLKLLRIGTQEEKKTNKRTIGPKYLTNKLKTDHLYLKSYKTNVPVGPFSENFGLFQFFIFTLEGKRLPSTIFMCVSERIVKASQSASNSNIPYLTKI